MPPLQAKLVTIITAYEARNLVMQALADLGVHSFSTSKVEGAGRHGPKLRGFIEAGNVEFAIVVSEPLSIRLLSWVEAKLLAEHPGIAYSADVLAVAARPIE